jgi:outer membrane receptor protein involved in Fe transport
VYKYQHRKQGDIKDPDFILDGGFGGPVPLVSKKLGGLRFFVSHNRERDMYLVPLSREAVDQNSTQLKLTSNITSSIKLTVGALYSELFGVNNNNNGLPGYFSTTNELASAIAGNTYKDAIVYGTDYWCPTSIYRHSLSLRLTHTLSSKTFYEASLERFGSFYKTIPRDMRDTSRVVKFGSSYWLDEAPFGFMPLPSTGINGLRMGVGMSNSRDYSKLYTMTGKFDIISQVNSTNQVKAGAELTYNDHNVKYGSIDITLPAGRPWSIWQQQPLRGALYLQDKVEFKGMIANVGVRYDYSNARSDWYDIGVYDRTFWGNQYTPELENTVVKTPTKAQSYFSPRLGVSHPITSSSKLYFNYGHFREMPTAEELYLVQRYTDNTLSRIGDPNLELSRTVAYELGYEQNVLNQLLFRLAAYYRDNMYQPNSVQYISADNKVSYYKRENNNYQDIRGFEVTMERRAGAWLTGIVNYTYMVYTSGYFGKLKQYENPAEQRTYDRDNIYQEKPLPQPYFKANLALRTPLTFGPRIAGFRPLSDWVIGSQFYWRVGSYYTWTGGASVAGVTYNTRYPNYYNLDLRISKSFTYKKYRLELYANVNNTLDYKYLSTSSFSDGLDQRDYQNSLYWPREVGQFISGGYSRYGLEYGTDRFGALRPKGVAYDPFELVLANPNSDPAIDAQNKDIIARNKKRVETKSYIDNPNMEWLYYLNPRDIYFGIRIEF